MYVSCPGVMAAVTMAKGRRSTDVTEGSEAGSKSWKVRIQVVVLGSHDDLAAVHHGLLIVYEHRYCYLLRR